MTERDAEPRRRRRKRRVATPRASFEELEIRTADGANLRAVVDDPPEETDLRATVVLAHAMSASRSTFGDRRRPGLARALALQGYRTIAFDFRGHGESVAPPGNVWSYDDLVRVDLPAVVDFAQARGEERPVVVLGHALGGQVALAAQGTGRMAVDGIVTLATTIWLRELDRSRLRAGARALLGRGLVELVDRAARIPALRRGADDPTARSIRHQYQVLADGRWASADGVEDYFAALTSVRVPVAAVLGDADRLVCDPASGEAFARRCAGPVHVTRVRAGHRSIATSEAARSAIVAAVTWTLNAKPVPVATETVATK